MSDALAPALEDVEGLPSAQAPSFCDKASVSKAISPTISKSWNLTTPSLAGLSARVNTCSSGVSKLPPQDSTKTAPNPMTALQKRSKTLLRFLSKAFPREVRRSSEPMPNRPPKSSAPPSPSLTATGGTRPFRVDCLRLRVFDVSALETLSDREGPEAEVFDLRLRDLK